MKKLLGVLIDVEKETAGQLEIVDELDEFYRILNCSWIDITTRHIGIGARCRKAFDIVCDDEGLLKEGAKISAINNLGQPQLVGNLFIVGTPDEEGSLTSLTQEDVVYILGKVQKLSTRKFPTEYPMLTQCEY